MDAIAKVATKAAITIAADVYKKYRNEADLMKRILFKNMTDKGQV